MVIVIPSVLRMERRYCEEEDIGSPSFSSDEDRSSLCDFMGSLSSEEDFMEGEATSSLDSSPSSSSSSSTGSRSLYEMSDLMAALPIKRGLSKYYQGKSQSFTSLAGVRSLQDIPKPERPIKKKLKTCKSYGGGLGEQKPYASSMRCCSKVITKKPSKGSLSSLSGKRQGLRPPVPRHRSESFPCQNLLFA